MKLFWLKGYESILMQDLVNELGINRFSIYSSFGGKKGIFLKSLAYYRKTVWAYLVSPLLEDKPAKQRLEYCLNQVQSESGRLCFELPKLNYFT